MQGMLRDMRSVPPPLLPLLRSPFQGEMLARLFLHPEQEFSLAALADHAGVSRATASREADRFAEAGLITERRRGNLRLVRANGDTPIAGPLAELLAVTYGPIAVLGELLSRLDGIDAAYIYGSWAARYRGRPGEVPRDVDVLVIGDIDEDDLYEIARNAEHTLGREVNMHRVSPQAWQAPGDDPFLSSVRDRPLVKLDLNGGSRHEVGTGS